MKRVYVKPDIISEHLEANAFACTCTSNGGSLESFLTGATNNFNG